MQITKDELSRVKSFRRELYRDDITEIEKIAGLYPRGYISINASEAGTGNTWLMEFITCQLSIGGTILNGLEIDAKPRKIVIMSGETGAELLNIRLASSNWEYNPQNISVYNSIDMGINGLPYLLNTPEGQHTLKIIMSAEKPDIIYFDTLISFHTADESKQADMISIYLFLAKIAKHYKCAVVLNHHTRKRPANQSTRAFNQDDVIGSSTGVRLANAVYLISAQENSNTITVKNVKAWDKKLKPFTYTFINRDGYTDFDINLHIEPEYSTDDKFQELINSLNDGALITISETAKNLQITKRIARYHLEKFVDSGRLTKTKFLGETAYKLKEDLSQ